MQIHAYALAQTFRILSPNRNRQVATCYGCRAKLAADFGHEVRQQSWFAGRNQVRFLCRACFEPVKSAHDYVRAEGAGDPGRPHVPEWWGDLDREAVVGAKRVRPRPGPREIDALIAEREGKQHE